MAECHSPLLNPPAFISPLWLMLPALSPSLPTSPTSSVCSDNLCCLPGSGHHDMNPIGSRVMTGKRYPVAERILFPMSPQRPTIPKQCDLDMYPDRRGRPNDGYSSSDPKTLDKTRTSAGAGGDQEFPGGLPPDRSRR